MDSEDEYIYKCKPVNDLISELFKTELVEIRKLSTNTIDPKTGCVVNPRDIALKQLNETRSSDIDKAIKDDSKRVLDNLVNIPLNKIVRVTPTTTVQRVHMGWIYIHETYSNCGAASTVIQKTSTFVPLVNV